MASRHLATLLIRATLFAALLSLQLEELTGLLESLLERLSLHLLLHDSLLARLLRLGVRFALRLGLDLDRGLLPERASLLLLWLLLNEIPHLNGVFVTAAAVLSTRTLK